MARLEVPGRGETNNRFRHEVREGLRYVRGHVWLWGTFVSATFTYLLFIGPTQVLLPYIVRNSLHAGAFTYGAVLAVGGVGALIGAALMGRAREPRRPVTWIYAWWTVATLAVAGYGLARQAWGLALAAPRREWRRSRRCGGLGHPETAPGAELHDGSRVQHRLVWCRRRCCPSVMP